MLRRVLSISVALPIASAFADGSHGSSPSLLACEQEGLNNTESQECCRWLRAWYAWQECDQLGQDCATEEALTNIEKKLCSHQCQSSLDDANAARHASESSRNVSASELRPFCAANVQPQQCPPLLLAGSNVDDFPWVCVVAAAAVASFWLVFVFHNRCLPKHRRQKSQNAPALNPGLKLLECEVMGTGLRGTATAAPDCAVASGSFGVPTETDKQAPQMVSLSSQVAEDNFGMEQDSKELSVPAPRSLSLPPPPSALPPAPQNGGSNLLAPIAAPAAAPSPLTVAAPMAAPSPSSVPPPVAPPPIWHAPSPVNQYSSQSPNSTQKWPPGLSFLWASRRAFLHIAFTGALLRVALLVMRVLIPDPTDINVAIQLTLIAFQLHWVKGPAPGKTGTELPAEVTHGGPGGLLPRFGVFAATTAVLELFSVAAALQPSLSHMCGFLPVVLNVLAGPATVARCYSAFLALRLQDEADKLARRIVPQAPDDPSPPLDANLGDICIDLGYSGSPASTQQMSPVKLMKEMGKSQKEPAKQRRSCLRNCSCRHRNGNEPQTTKRPRTRALVIAGSVIAVLGSVALALALSLAKPEDEVNNELPSSCVTRQNSTTTCEFYEQLGSAIGGADPLNACCRGCDELEGCQAWIFDDATTRCRWVKFTQQPCATTPDKASCRCMTHPGAVFGYRPTRKIVAVHSN